MGPTCIPKPIMNLCFNHLQGEIVRHVVELLYVSIKVSIKVKAEFYHSFHFISFHWRVLLRQIKT